MSIETSGLCLSNLLYEQVNCFSDSDGFLVGHTKNIISNAISDQSTNDVSEKTIFEITKIISCHEATSWYDRKYRINKNAINDISMKAKAANEEILGWYKSRRESSLVGSLKEKHLTSQLRKHFQSNSFIFLLLTSSNSSLESNSTQCLHSYDFQFFILKQNEPIAPSLINVTNLGSYLQSDYRMISNISSHINDFPNRDADSSSISAINSMFDQLNIKSEGLKNVLLKSEEKLAYETQKLLNLREELQFLRKLREDKNIHRPTNESNVGHLIDLNVEVTETCKYPPKAASQKVATSRGSDLLASPQCLLTSPIPDNLNLESSIFDSQIESSI